MVEDRKPRTTSGIESELLARLESLETQIIRLTSLLESQTKLRRQRRVRFSIRTLLASFALFAFLFAWFGTVLQKSQRQARAADQLVKQGVHLSYTPRDSLIVGVLPGNTEAPPRLFTRWFGYDLFQSVTNASTRFAGIKNQEKQETLDAVFALTDLERLSLTKMQLSTNDLTRLSSVPSLQSLDVSHTVLDSGRLEKIAESKLRWLDVSHTRLSGDALKDIAQCKELRHLNLERTSIDDASLEQLASIPTLRYLNLNRTPVSKKSVQELSASMPNCVIEWQPLRFLASGRTDSRAARRGAIRLGTPKEDPRPAMRVTPPQDQAEIIWRMNDGSTFRQQRYLRY
ncbi:MAG: hypothetical protein AAFX06_02835 [Planctomycetota bacterium]